MKNIIFTILLALFFSGCAAISGYESDIQSYNQQILQRDCGFDDDKKAIENGNDVLYVALKAGMRARICKEYELSNNFFDIAESRYKNDVDLKSFFASIGDGVSGTFLNSNSLDYDGRFYERIMINVYKALNFMALGKFDYARVELNRALNRQERAKEYYVDEILKAQNLLNDKAKSRNQIGFSDSQISKLSNIYTQNIQAIYPNFINPFATYLSGLFFMLENDKKGYELLKESLEMQPSNLAIKQDIKFAKSGKKEPQIWLIYENGQSAGLKEEVFHIPLFLFSDEVYHAGIALPVLTSPKQSYTNLELNGQKTSQVADMNAIIQTEFAKISPILIRKEILRALFKSALQYSASQISQRRCDSYGRCYDDLNPLAMLFGIYSAITTKADIRYIPTLPSNFQSVRVPNLGNAMIKDDNGAVLLNLQTDKNKNTIIYLKSLTKGFFEFDKIEF
ncbi:COG3014 family protein [Campylobacter geochelonis]|uniref:COG3014 family protein n=1 Tax=Campylobacter geochelonis TaxID=1780362 RepID=UPI0007707662|nr:hypothetical protein [Campylobacter geochelonis]CZE51144.1 lipoprotein [Campylobacter geochelonis]